MKTIGTKSAALLTGLALLASVSVAGAAFSSAAGDLGAGAAGQVQTPRVAGMAGSELAGLQLVASRDAQESMPISWQRAQERAQDYLSEQKGTDFNAAVVAARISPVPEVTTMLAGAGAVGLLFLGAGAHSKRNVFRIGK